MGKPNFTNEQLSHRCAQRVELYVSQLETLAHTGREDDSLVVQGAIEAALFIADVSAQPWTNRITNAIARVSAPRPA